MAELTQLFSLLKEQLSANVSRSDAMRHLYWLMSFFIILLVGALIEKAETWITIVIFCFIGVTLLANFAAYAFWAVKNPDALRSERYSLNKMAIEHGIIGDNLTGLVSEGDKRGKPRVIDHIESQDNG